MLSANKLNKWSTNCELTISSLGFTRYWGSSWTSLTLERWCFVASKTSRSGRLGQRLWKVSSGNSTLGSFDTETAPLSWPQVTESRWLKQNSFTAVGKIQLSPSWNSEPLDSLIFTEEVWQYNIHDKVKSAHTNIYSLTGLNQPKPSAMFGLCLWEVRTHHVFAFHLYNGRFGRFRLAPFESTPCSSSRRLQIDSLRPIFHIPGLHYKVEVGTENELA